MTPEQVRNANWEDIQAELSGLRAEVHEALLRLGGPVTTRALAAFMGRDLLTVRPRVTELVDLGLACPCGHRAEEGHKREGLYQAVPLHTARAAHDRRHAEARTPAGVQQEIPFHG